jgi:hypothetical protein
MVDRATWGRDNLGQDLKCCRGGKKPTGSKELAEKHQ